MCVTALWFGHIEKFVVMFVMSLLWTSTSRACSFEHDRAHISCTVTCDFVTHGQIDGSRFQEVVREIKTKRKGHGGEYVYSWA